MSDWDSKKYKENSEPQQEGGLAAINNLVFNGNETILDIGCGDGRTTVEIAKKVPDGKVVAIDPSPSMIEECNASFSELKNITFIQAGAEDYSLDQKFDYVLSFYALHYVKDHLDLLKKIHHSLNSGGKLLFTMAGGEQANIAEVFNREPWKSIFSENKINWHAQTEEGYKELLSLAGFTDFKVKTVNIPRYFTKEGLFNWAIAWVPYVTGLDKEKSVKFTDELVENVCQGQEGLEQIEMASPILYIEATKS